MLSGAWATWRCVGKRKVVAVVVVRILKWVVALFEAGPEFVFALEEMLEGLVFVLAVFVGGFHAALM